MILPVSFVGKSILVTGAGRGLGKTLVHSLVQNGGKVIALSKTKENLDQLKKELPEVTTLCADVLNWNETREAVESVGRVDLLVNNAGINMKGTVLEATPEDFDRMYNANTRSVLNITQAVVNGMMSRNTGGSIVNIASLSVRSIIKKQSLYATSKAALDSLTKYMALELGRNNIRVNNVSPGLFPSDMSNVSIQNPKNPILLDTLNRSPLGRMGTREEIANVVLFLLSDYSSFITGETIYVSGGLR